MRKAHLVIKRQHSKKGNNMYTLSFTKEELERVKEWGEIVRSEDDWDDADESAFKRVEGALRLATGSSVAKPAESLNQMQFNFGDEDEEDDEE